MQIELPYQFVPRAYQIPVLAALDSGKKRAYIVWNRRAGKDKTLWNFLIKRAFEVKGQHFYLFPTFVQAKRDIWENIDNDGMKFLDHIPAQLIDGKPNETELKIKLKNDSIIQLIGTDKYDAIRGANPKTCVFSEYAYQDPRAYDVVRPILRSNGGVAVFDTTPLGDNHAKELWDMAKDNPDWFAQLLTVDDTKTVTPEDIQKERDEGMSEEMVQQEFYCSWSSALVGSYFGTNIRQLEESNRITDVPWDELSSVTTFWDIGVDDEMSIVFVQKSGFVFKIIDFYSNHGEGFDHYAKVLKDKPYKYDQHCLPHDAKNRDMTKRASEGLERYKTLDSLLREPVIVLPRPKSKEDKIEATRAILPKCYIDKDKCSYLVTSLKSYRQEYDEKLKKWKDEPVHDWSSHAFDAFSYFALFVRKGHVSSAATPQDFSWMDDIGGIERRNGIVR